MLQLNNITNITMNTKKETTQKSLKPTSKSKNKKIEKIEKSEDNQSFDKRKNNGGKREGSGRKKSQDRERLVTLKDKAEDFALEEIDVQEKNGTNFRVIKMTRNQALLNVLFEEGFKRKSIPAIKEFFDRTRGKSRQELELSGEIDTGDQYLPTGNAIDKAYEVFEREQRKLIAQDYDPEL